jgi:hypothetical protein
MTAFDLATIEYLPGGEFGLTRSRSAAEDKISMLIFERFLE